MINTIIFINIINKLMTDKIVTKRENLNTFRVKLSKYDFIDAINNLANK